MKRPSSQLGAITHATREIRFYKKGANSVYKLYIVAVYRCCLNAGRLCAITLVKRDTSLNKNGANCQV